MDEPQPGAARPDGEGAAGRAGGCARCGHPYALHSNGTTPCRAFACTAGPHEGPCEGFVTAEQLAALPA